MLEYHVGGKRYRSFYLYGGEVCVPKPMECDNSALESSQGQLDDLLSAGFFDAVYRLTWAR